MILALADEDAAQRERYDPFVSGSWRVRERDFEAYDEARGRLFPCHVWYPEGAARPSPLIVFSHSSGGDRTSTTYLCRHLSSHGYVVAAMDHSERVAPDLMRPDAEETAEQRERRVEGMIAARVPDVRFLIDDMLHGSSIGAAPIPDPDGIGIVGDSFGGWTALAAPDTEPRIRAVVALAPGGSSNPRPGIIPATLAFRWGRDVPTLYLVAEQDTALPLKGMFELFDRTPATKRMVILRRADHLHFVDDVEREHEAMRALPSTGDLAWVAEMRPIGELCSAVSAHTFVRGLTLAHLDATLQRDERAEGFLSGDIQAALAERTVEAVVHRP